MSKSHAEVYSEYYETHQSRLEALALASEDILDRSAPFTVEQSAQGGIDVQNGLTGQEIIELGTGIPPAIAAELADNENQSLISSAKISFVALQSEASMQYVTDYQSVVRTRLLGCQEATWRYLDTETVGGKAIELTVTTLKGLDQYREGSKYEITLFDQGVRQTLRVTRLGESIVSAHSNVKPEHDQLISRAIQVMGAEGASLFNELAGNFTNQDELDSKLSGTWLKFRGTAQEDEVGPLLDEVRDRAEAAKESIEFNNTYALDLPSMDKIEKFEAALFEI